MNHDIMIEDGVFDIDPHGTLQAELGFDSKEELLEFFQDRADDMAKQSAHLLMQSSGMYSTEWLNESLVDAKIESETPYGDAFTITTGTDENGRHFVVVKAHSDDLHFATVPNAKTVSRHLDTAELEEFTMRGTVQGTGNFEGFDVLYGFDERGFDFLIVQNLGNGGDGPHFLLVATEGA